MKNRRLLERYNGLKLGWLHDSIFFVTAAVSCIIFLVTEDMTNTMAYTDRWTILMALILIADIVILVMAKRKKKEEDP